MAALMQPMFAAVRAIMGKARAGSGSRQPCPLRCSSPWPGGRGASCRRAPRPWTGLLSLPPRPQGLPATRGCASVSSRAAGRPHAWRRGRGRTRSTPACPARTRPGAARRPPMVPVASVQRAPTRAWTRALGACATPASPRRHWRTRRPGRMTRAAHRAAARGAVLAPPLLPIVEQAWPPGMTHRPPCRRV